MIWRGGGGGLGTGFLSYIGIFIISEIINDIQY